MVKCVSSIYITAWMYCLFPKILIFGTSFNDVFDKFTIRSVVHCLYNPSSDRILLSKQWIKGSLANLICEAKSLSKQDLLIMITCLSKNVQPPKTVLFKLATFPIFIESLLLFFFSGKSGKIVCFGHLLYWWVRVSPIENPRPLSLLYVIFSLRSNLFTCLVSPNFL